MMNCRASSSLRGYSMQLISCRSSKNADRQCPKPARIVPFVVIRIGTGTDWSFSRASSSNSSISPVQPSSSSARCSRSCSGERTTGRPSNRLIAVGLKGSGGAYSSATPQITSCPLMSGSCRLNSLRSCSSECNHSPKMDASHGLPWPSQLRTNEIGERRRGLKLDTTWTQR
jgi:hypothetical protein